MRVTERRTMIFSLVMLGVTAVFATGYLYPDEHFQVLEFAALKLGMTTARELPWEYHSQMRPAIQPGLAFVVHRVAAFVGLGNPFTVAFLLRLLSALLTFLGMQMIYRRYRHETGEGVLKQWFLLLSFLTWFAMGLGVRFTSETWSGSLFIVAFCLYFAAKPPAFTARMLSAGFVAGLSFLFRFQAGFLVGGLFLWMVFIRREKLLHLFLFITGILAAVALGMLTDRWFYGEWVVTFRNYFLENIVYGKLSGFGIQPWYFYFTDTFIRAIPPFSLVIVLCFPLLFIFRPKDPVTWTVLPFLAIHFLAGHKETRFLYPVIGFLPVAILRSVMVVRDRWKPSFPEMKGTRYAARAFWVVNLMALAVVAFSPADPQAVMFRKIYNGYPGAATLYYIDENPYHRAREIRYYRRPGLEVKQVASWDEAVVTPGRATLAVVKRTDNIRDLGRKKKVVYTSFPDWIKTFNFNHWIERTNFWYVYELQE